MTPAQETALGRAMLKMALSECHRGKLPPGGVNPRPQLRRKTMSEQAARREVATQLGREKVGTVGTFIRAAAEKSGFTVSELTGRTRRRDIVDCRQDAMLEAWKAGHDKSAIGRAFNRDHSTVDNSLRMALQRSLDRMAAE